LAATDARKNFRLSLIGAFIDVDAGGALGLPGPQITLPSSNPDEAAAMQFGALMERRRCYRSRSMSGRAPAVLKLVGSDTWVNAQ
jgi:hypothetical protein